MKKKRNFFIKLIILSIILIFLGCEKDLYDEHLHNTKDKNSISFEQFKAETGISNFKTHISIKNLSDSFNARTASGGYELSDFIIDTEIIKRLEVNQETTYSFKVYPVDQELLVDKEYYNLVYEKNGNLWNQIIFKNKENEIIIDGQPQIESSTMIYNSKMIEGGFHSFSFFCGTINIDNVCPRISPCTQNYCDGCTARCVSITVSYASCDSGGNSSSPGSGNTGTPDNGGSGSVIPGDDTGQYTPNPYDLQDATSFVAEHQLQQKTPCQELKKVAININEKNALQDLETKTNESQENGYYITRNNGSINHNIPQPAYSSSFSPNEIVMPTGGNNIGAFHTHPTDSDGWYPMFSDGDLNYLFKVAKNHNTNGQPKNYSEYFLTLTVPEGTFAIKIKDPLKFYNFRNNGRWRGDELPALRNKYQARNPTDNIKAFQKDLLTLLNENDAGVGLYEASSDLSSWSELVLDNVNPNADPIKQPCN